VAEGAGVGDALALVSGLSDSVDVAGGPGNMIGADGAEAGPCQDESIGTTEYITFCWGGGVS
jgi:hypothetical protein